MLLSLKVLGTLGLAAGLAVGGVNARPEVDHHPPAPAEGAAPAPASEENSTRPVEVGEEANIEAGEAGEVSIARTSEGIELNVVDPAEGWEHKVEDDAGDEIDVRFFANGRLIHLKLTLDGMNIHINIIDSGRPAEPAPAETDADEDGDDASDEDAVDDETSDDEAADDDESTTTTTASREETTEHDAGGAGKVKLISKRNRLALLQVKLSLGWDYDVVRHSGDTVKVLFHQNRNRVLFVARIDAGDVKVNLEPSDDSEELPAKETETPADEAEAPSEDETGDTEETDAEDESDDDTELSPGTDKTPPAKGHKKHG